MFVYLPALAGEASTATVWQNFKPSLEKNNKNLNEINYVNANDLHDVQPGAKIIVALRNPTDR